MCSNLQSPIVRFGIFLGSAIFVLSSLVSGYFLTNIFLEAKAAEGWPHTEGKLERVEIVMASARWYHSDVAYRYNVQGRAYVGTRIRTSDGKYNERESVEREVWGLRVGEAVRVFYNPENPKKSVLRTGAGFQEYGLLCIPLIMLSVGLFGVYYLRKYKKRANHPV